MSLVNCAYGRDLFLYQGVCQGRVKIHQTAELTRWTQLGKPPSIGFFLLLLFFSSLGALDRGRVPSLCWEGIISSLKRGFWRWVKGFPMSRDFAVIVFGAVPDNMKKCYRGTDEKESIKQD